MDFSIKLDEAALEKGLSDLERRQLPYAISHALNATAFDVRREIMRVLPEIFDRPTPYTVNSLFIVKSTKRSLYAIVGYKKWATKGSPAVKYLYPHIAGGTRPYKRSEKLLAGKGLIPKESYLIMAKSATKNQYGNIPTSKYSRLLSGLGARLDPAQVSRIASGRRATRTNASRFFVGVPRGGNLRPRAVYERAGGKLRPLFFITPHVKYKPRFHFYQIVESTVQRQFPINFQKAMARAMATARR